MPTLEDVPDEPDADVELILPEHFLPANRFPDDARRMGIDHYTGEGAMIGLASAMDGSKLSHRLLAVALLVIFVGSFGLRLWSELHLS